ncbi:hypothetical protein BHE74_00044091 [Ensete ventricosum]|nr:hypothetical protein BHE74_00044091 [Ensete ventricosum]
MSEVTPSENYCEVWLRYVARARTDQTGRDVRLRQRLLDWPRYTTRAKTAGLAEIHNSGKDCWTGRVRTMRLGTHQECIGSLLRVSGAYQDGAREFTGRRLRLVERLSRVVERLGGRFDLHPKEINSGRRCASRKRTQEVDVGHD